MLKEYNQLFDTYKQQRDEYYNLLARAQNQKLECTQFKNTLDFKAREYEKSVSAEVEKMLQQKIREVSSEYSKYTMDLEGFEEEVSREIGHIKGILDSNQFIVDDNYNNNFSELESKCEDIRAVFEQYVPAETINLYTKLSYTINFSNGELGKLTEWLKYFDNFDDYDALISKAETIEAKINSNGDKSFIIFALLIFVSLVIALRWIMLPIYSVFIFATLYIRCKKYFYLIKLLSVFNILSTRKQNLAEQYSEKIAEFVGGEKVRLAAIQENYDNQFSEIREAIAFMKDADEQKVKKNFNYEEASEIAKSNLEKDDAAISLRISEGEEILKTLEEQVSEKADQCAETKEKLSELRNKIIESYAKLQPTFIETDLLADFFLGFDKDKNIPITFKYSGEPSIIFFQGNDESSYDAVIKTITMMCAQIMCIMSPTSYKLNVIDTRTAGSKLSAFQVTSTKEESTESQLFQVITTTQEATRHIKDLYELFMTRRVKILGNYADIDDYNHQKISKNAKPEMFNINFFLHFDYKLLNQTEEIKILCRVAKSVGITLIFIIDTEQINKDDKSIKAEDLYRFLELFNEQNLFGFSIQDNSVEIVGKTLEEIHQKFNDRKEI